MSLKDPVQARGLLKEFANQPRQIVFGVDQAIDNTVLAFITPIPRDSASGKEWAQAHVYMLDLPGRGKTAISTCLSASVEAKLGRVDGRPDLMPSDLVGREEADRGTGIRTLLKGPIHSNVFFMDEINRTPPKGQAVMLGAMEGGYVIMNVTDLQRRVVEAKSFPLHPISDDSSEKRMFFIVMATANPIEFEGTYPLSEAQKERFTYSFRIGRPDREHEMMVRAGNVAGKKIKKVMNLSELLDIQDMVKKVELSGEAHELIMRYIENSMPQSQDLEESERTRKRHATSDLIKFVDTYVANGCSVRRNFHMEAAAKAWAFMRGENSTATAEDVKAVAPITMEHVILLQPGRALANKITTKQVVQRIISETTMP